MPAISVIMPTARDDFPIIGLPDLHLFEPTMKSLVKQNFKDFEVIIVDAFHKSEPMISVNSHFRLNMFPLIQGTVSG